MNQNFVTIYKYCIGNWDLLVRYGISGVSGVLANLIVFGVLVEYYQWWYVYGAVLGFVAAYIVTFSMHKWWTFTATASTRTVTQGTLYLSSALLGLVCTIVSLKVLIEWIGLWPLLAQFVTLGMVGVLSFIFTAQVTFHADQSRLRAVCQKLKHAVNVHKVRHLFWLTLLSVVLITTASIRLGTMPVFISSDTQGFAQTADLLLGEDVAVNGARYLKPLAPAVIAVLSQTGVDTVSGVLLQAVLFFFALGFAVYWFGFLLLRSKAGGFVMATVIATSLPIVKYGLDYMTETGAWALYFLSLSLMVLWYHTPKTKWLWLLSLSLLLGVLWKEYAVLAGLTFFFLLCFHPRLSLSNKIHALLQSSFLVLIPWAMWQYHVYVSYQYSYLDWMSIGAAPEAYATMYTIPAVVKSMSVLLGVGWVYVLFGLRQYRTLAFDVQFFTKIMVLPAFGFLLWGYVSSRLFFSIVPLAAIFATIGVLIQKDVRIKITMVVLCAVISMGLAWISFVPDIRALIDSFTYGT